MIPIIRRVIGLCFPSGLFCLANITTTLFLLQDFYLPLYWVNKFILTTYSIGKFSIQRTLMIVVPSGCLTPMKCMQPLVKHFGSISMLFASHNSFLMNKLTFSGLLQYPLVLPRFIFITGFFQLLHDLIIFPVSCKFLLFSKNHCKYITTIRTQTS